MGNHEEKELALRELLMINADDKSFAAAADTSKLLITLATGSLAVGLALINPEMGKTTLLAPATSQHKIVLASALISLLCSASCGIWTQLAITHVLSESSPASPANIWDLKIRVPLVLQLFAFLVGIAVYVSYGIVRLIA